MSSRLTRLLHWVFSATAITLAGCATNQGTGQGDLETTRSVATDCFTVSLARDFRFLDDHNLIVFAAARQPYHVELGAVCIGLRGEFQIGLRARSDRMCGFAGDAVIVDGALSQRCPVLSVRRLDENQLQALLVQFDQAVPGVVEGEVVELPDESNQ